MRFRELFSGLLLLNGIASIKPTEKKSWAVSKWLALKDICFFHVREIEKREAEKLTFIGARIVGTALVADGADQALRILQWLQQRQQIKLVDTAVVTWQQGSKGPKTRQIVEAQTRA